MEDLTWKPISTTVYGRKIEGEYCVDGHFAKVRIGDHEKGIDLKKSDAEASARQLLRELAEEGKA